MSVRKLVLMMAIMLVVAMVAIRWQAVRASAPPIPERVEGGHVPPLASSVRTPAPSASLIPTPTTAPVTAAPMPTVLPVIPAQGHSYPPAEGRAQAAVTLAWTATAMEAPGTFQLAITTTVHAPYENLALSLFTRNQVQFIDDRPVDTFGPLATGGAHTSAWLIHFDESLVQLVASIVVPGATDGTHRVIGITITRDGSKPDLKPERMGTLSTDKQGNGYVDLVVP